MCRRADDPIRLSVCEHVSHRSVDWSRRLSDRRWADPGRDLLLAIERHINLSDRIGTRNRLADAFEEWCYETMIVYGEKARSEFRHKTYSFLWETTNVLILEGSFIDYVLESYERGYLSLLLAASHANV